MQAALLGRDCTNCWRLMRAHNPVQVLPTAYFCPVCLNSIPRGRMGLSTYLSLTGFFLLLIATMLLEKLPQFASQNILWLGFIAAYSFYLVQFSKGVRIQLFR